MTNETPRFKHGFGLFLIVLVFSANSCNRAEKTVEYHMGDQAQAGPIVYTVLEADWKSQLGAPGSERVPKQRFLVLHVTATNTAGREVMPPLGRLQDEMGASVVEESNGEGINQWLGIIRRLAPRERLDGNIVFDVAPRNYKLLLSDDGDTGQEKTVVFDIPLQIMPAMQEIQRLENIPQPVPTSPAK